MIEVEIVEIAVLTHDGVLPMEPVELERMDGHLPDQCPGLDRGYAKAPWTENQIAAMPVAAQAIPRACPHPGLCFAEGLTAGTQCGPCQRWVDDPEQWLRDNALQNERHRARYGRKEP